MMNLHGPGQKTWLTSPVKRGLVRMAIIMAAKRCQVAMRRMKNHTMMTKHKTKRS
jgi:hypothetical protein